MKRSEINKIITNTIKDIEKNKIPLPFFAYYQIDDWKNSPYNLDEIFENKLGWDVTDFGKGDYHKKGLTSFVFRNGNPNKKKKYPKLYCEKILIVEDGQELPFHFHWEKTEDIINRGGGILELTLFNSNSDKSINYNTDIQVSMDGVSKVFPPGSKVYLYPGDSITLTPYIYHKWQGLKGTGKIFLFEVSTTNDDEIDNNFLDNLPRLIEITNDEEKKYLTISDYHNI